MHSQSGFIILPKFILQNKSLTADCIVLYANLLHFDRGSVGRGCIAKRSTIATFCNFSVRRVRNAVNLLEQEGIISIIRRRNSLTDRITINPDCRPPTKSTNIPAPKKDLSTPTIQPGQSGVDDNAPVREVRKTQLSSINNKTKQVNNISTCPKKVLNSPKETGADGKIISHSPLKPTQVQAPIPKHLSRSKPVKSSYNPLLVKILYHLQKDLRKTSYDNWFSDTWIDEVTDDEIKLITPKDANSANFIHENYASKLERIAGKKVSVLSNQ